MKITSPRVLAQLKVIVLALVIAVGGSYVFAYSTWVGPTASPTNNNADTPLNVGANTQDKQGRLRLNLGLTDAYGLDVYNKSRFFGNLEVGTTSSPAKVKIVDGTQANGSVLVSDATGLASWKATSTLGLGGTASSSGGFTNMLVFDTTPAGGSWTVPAGVTKVMVEAWGAGGAGKMSDLTVVPSVLYGFSASGGAGGYGKGIYTVVPGENYTVTVGTGSVSNSGGNSSFGSFITSNGGGAGVPYPIKYDFVNHIPAVNTLFSSSGTSLPSAGLGGTSNGTVSIKGGNGDIEPITVLSGSLGQDSYPLTHQDFASWNNSIAKGGDAPNGGTGGVTAIATYDYTSNGSIFTMKEPAISALCSGAVPGGGGAGGYFAYSNNSGLYAGLLYDPPTPDLCAGGNGRVIIHY